MILQGSDEEITTRRATFLNIMMMIVDSHTAKGRILGLEGCYVVCGNLWELMSLGKIEAALKGFWLQCIQSSPYGHEYSELLDKIPTDLC